MILIKLYLDVFYVNNISQRFLYVGCGDGKLTMEFVEVIKPKEIYGIGAVDKLCEEIIKRIIIS